MGKRYSHTELARSVWRDFRRARRSLLVFEVLFKLFETWLLLPALTFALAFILARSGHIAVSNLDILDYLLSPLGLLYTALLIAATAALLLYDQAGVMVIATLAATERPRPGQPSFADIGKIVLRVAKLGALMAGLLVLASLPFVLLGWLTYCLLLTEFDIYFYLTVRPPAFWIATGIGSALLIAATGIGAWLCIRWALALPIVIFEGQSAWSALRASSTRVRGAGWRFALILLGWPLMSVLVGFGMMALFRLLAAAVLEHAGEQPIVFAFFLLLAQGALLAIWSFVLTAGQGLLTRALYRVRSEELGISGAWKWGPAEPDRTIPPWRRRLVYLSIPLFLLMPVTLWFQMSHFQVGLPRVRITAHRGHARAAPENTLSAVRKAIASGADYVEIDVQRTADGVLVLLHDRDLLRVAGDPRRLSDVTYEEARRLDVGSWFSPAFAGERIPTLAEVIQLCRGKIKINIELKVFGSDPWLARDVARLVREQVFEAECIVTSLQQDAVEQVRRTNPRLRTGLIVAHALGDISQLDGEVLSVRADALTRTLVRAARRRGIEVHAWTVNDDRQVGQMIKLGVDNVLTSDPDMAIRVREHWADLTGSERVILASRLLLGLEP